MASLLDELVQAYANFKVSRYTAVSALTLCVYDWLILFGDECEYIGKAKRSKGRTLYYFGRIWTFIGIVLSVFHLLELRPPLSDKFCMAWAGINPLMLTFSVLSSYWLLTLRIIALYRSKKYFVWFMYISLFGCYAASLGFTTEAIIHMARSAQYFPLLNVCIYWDLPKTLQASFEVPLVFESLLFALICYRAYHDYRSQLTASSVPLLRIMYRDGVLSFVVLFSLRVWNIVVYATQPVSKMFDGLYLMWTLITILACRIYLNIVREARRKEAYETYTRGLNFNVDGQSHAWAAMPDHGTSSKMKEASVLDISGTNLELVETRGDRSTSYDETLVYRSYGSGNEV